jgi:hypothetical protein
LILLREKKGASFMMLKENLLIVLFLCQTAGSLLMSSEIIIEENSEGYGVFEDQNKIFFYQKKARSLEGKYSRSHYIHPLFDLNGEVLTEDFPEDHFHHRGIFWGWHQIWIGDQRIGDSWSLEDFYWDIRKVTILNTDGYSKTLNILVHWKSPNWKTADKLDKPFIQEKTDIRIFKKENKTRKIDFKISLLALEKNIRLGGSEDEKGYGGFSVRIKLPQDIIFQSITGPVQPQNLQIAGGPWMDMSGSFNSPETKNGITILDHKKNPNYPQPWILRSKDSMQNIVFPGREAVPISTESATILQYRIIIHDGKLSNQELAELRKEYDKGTMD